jgi:methionyl-tRNA synthetase
MVKGCIKMTENIISFEDFQKLNLRVAEILEVEDIEGADKLYKLKIDVGEFGQRIICAGIKEFYSKEKLQNKKIIIIENLAPRKMRGIESHGMLLAADENGKPVLLAPEKNVENGCKVR